MFKMVPGSLNKYLNKYSCAQSCSALPVPQETPLCGQNNLVTLLHCLHTYRDFGIGIYGLSAPANIHSSMLLIDQPAYEDNHSLLWAAADTTLRMRERKQVQAIQLQTSEPRRCVHG